MKEPLPYNERDQVYIANPTAARFHASNAFVRLLMGPVGSGKSVAACIEVFARAKRQKPSPDGIRRSRWAIIRNTYPELKSTTMKTWTEWFPEDLFSGVKLSSPMTHHIKIGDVDLEVLFLALDSPADIKKLLSLEVTGVWINEAKELPKAVFDVCRQRTGRYPRDIENGWKGIICDTNPPDEDHWIYKVFEEEKPEGYEIFKQPGAIIFHDNAYKINPKAENLENLKNAGKEKYYLNQIPGSSQQYIRVYLMGQYGSVQDGKPVYPSYNDRLHASDTDLIANPKLPIGFGWDFGNTPACAIVQFTARGQLQVIDELFTEDMGIRQFADNIVIPYLNKMYPFWKSNYVSFGDPAGNTKVQTDERTCMSILSELGIDTLSAMSNLQSKRKDAVNYFLNKLVDGEPGIIISARCKKIRKGFLGGYKYARVQVSGEERYRDEPYKNSFSHIMEALEYIAMNYATNTQMPDKEFVKPYTLIQGNFMRY